MKKHEIVPTFKKQQFLASKQFTTAQKDVLSALLQDGQSYTLEQARQLTEDFLKKETR
ncbi:MAG TPA: hypothetical protein VFV52_00165 [Bacilli bacterium]|nr:hypothetical protein [Bacilli bacterium]